MFWGCTQYEEPSQFKIPIPMLLIFLKFSHSNEICICLISSRILRHPVTSWQHIAVIHLSKTVWHLQYSTSAAKNTIIQIFHCGALAWQKAELYWSVSQMIQPKLWFYLYYCFVLWVGGGGEGEGKDEGFLMHSEAKLWSRCIKLPKDSTNLIDIQTLASTQQLQGHNLQEKYGFLTAFWMAVMVDLVSIYYCPVFCVATYISASWL